MYFEMWITLQDVPRGTLFTSILERQKAFFFANNPVCARSDKPLFQSKYCCMQHRGFGSGADCRDKRVNTRGKRGEEAALFVA